MAMPSEVQILLSPPRISRVPACVARTEWMPGRRGLSLGTRGSGGRIERAGIAQLARARAFQARGRGFESRFPLHLGSVASGRGAGRPLSGSARSGGPLRWGWWVAVLWLVSLACLAVAAHAASPEALRLNEAAVAAVRRGDYDAAASLLDQALRLDPRDGVLRGNLARVRTVMGHRFLRLRQAERAAEQYRVALDLAPEEMAALLGLGDALLEQRETRAAVEVFRRAVAVDPNNPDARVRLGQAYYSGGELEAALSEWRMAQSLRPEDAPLRGRIEQVEREARVQAGYRSRVSQHFSVTYEGKRQEETGRELVRLLEAAYEDIGYALGGYPPYEVPIILYSDADFTAATGYSTGIGGFYHPVDGKIRVALQGLNTGDPRLRSLLYHEYSHALVHAITQGNNPPRWVHEGLAIHLERRRAPGFKQEAIRQAQAGSQPSLDGSPYVLGSVAVEHLIDRYGLATMQLLLRRLGQGQPFPEAFQETYRMDLAMLEQTVRDLVTRGY